MTRTALPILPVSEVLPEIGTALCDVGRAVLSAPPGAGKTTLVPLYLLDQPWRGDGRIILLEPRRLAARAAAARMASLLGEEVGATVGYRMRLDTKISARTRIEVVTDGVFARMVLDDPELAGVSTVIFDEFHERSLDADFGLALALDVQSALRDDLRILVMSATLDIERVAQLLGQPPVIESMGRSFPIDVRYRDRPAGERIEDSVTAAIVAAHRDEKGSILAFLPGQAEITRTAERRGTVRAGDADSAAVREPQPEGAGRGGPPDCGGDAQDRAGDLDRRNVDYHRRRARCDRQRPATAGRLQAGDRRHPAGNGAGVSRFGRPASGTRRTDGAGYCNPALASRPDGGAAGVYTAADTLQRSFKSGARPCPLGRRGSRQSRLRRSAAGRDAFRGAELAQATGRARSR